MSCILPILNVKAIDGFVGFLGIDVPRSTNDCWYSGLDHNKTQDSKQWYYSSGAIDKLTGSQAKISGRTWDGSKNSAWINFPKNTYVNWGDTLASSGGNIFRGTYGMDIRRSSTALAKANHSGSWYLNENKMM